MTTTATRDRSDLRRNSDFLKLWAGETISQIGAQVTVLALPLTAIISLDASPGQLGLLTAAQFAPVLLITLFAGVWLDRHRKRPALIVANLGRAVLLGLVPLLYLLDSLTMTALYGIAFLAGLLTAIFDVAYVVYLPSLVARDKLVEANARLESTYSIALIGGPGLGGLLVQALTAPIAVLVDAVSYLAAAVSVGWIRRPEPPPARVARPASTWAEIGPGMAATLRDPVLRPLAAQSAWFNLFEQYILTLYLLYGLRDLHLSAGLLGAIMAIGSVGALFGAFVAARAGATLGVGRTLVWSATLSCAAFAFVPAAAGPPLAAAAVLAAGLFLGGFGLAVFNVHSLSLRAAIVPERLLGRVTATYRFLVFGTIPLGGLLGGFLGGLLGLRTALVIAVIALVAGAAVFARTRVRAVTMDAFRHEEVPCSAA
jgi:MFS family permease